MQVHDPLATRARRRHEYGIELMPRDALPPADAVVLAVPHDAYVAEGWRCVVPLLKNGRGIVIDVKARLDRDDKAGGNRALAVVSCRYRMRVRQAQRHPRFGGPPAPGRELSRTPAERSSLPP